MPRWYLIPLRILLLTFLLALMAFAVSLLLGILGILITAHIQAQHPDMTVAYRHVALPVAAVVATFALIATTIVEIRNYRQTRTLAAVLRASR